MKNRTSLPATVGRLRLEARSARQMRRVVPRTCFAPERNGNLSPLGVMAMASDASWLTNTVQERLTVNFPALAPERPACKKAFRGPSRRERAASPTTRRAHTDTAAPRAAPRGEGKSTDGGAALLGGDSRPAARGARTAGSAAR